HRCLWRSPLSICARRRDEAYLLDTPWRDQDEQGPAPPRSGRAFDRTRPRTGAVTDRVLEGREDRRADIQQLCPGHRNGRLGGEGFGSSVLDRAFGSRIRTSPYALWPPPFLAGLVPILPGPLSPS